MPDNKKSTPDSDVESKKLLDEALPKDIKANNFKLFQDFLSNIHIDPFKQFYYVWVLIVSIAFVYNLVFLIARISFWILQEDLKQTWIILDYFFSDIIYVLDIFLSFCTGFMENGELCIDKKKMALRYLKSSEFLIDILSILPLEIVIYLFDPKIMEVHFYLHPILRLNRLLKSYRLSEFRSITETKTQFPTVFRMTNLLINILLAMHWNACFYFMISRAVGFGSDNWVFPQITNPELMSNMTQAELNNMLQTHKLDVQYIYCFWWSVLTLTTIGEVQQPHEYYQEMYMSILLMLGVIILAITIGSAADMVQDANCKALELQEKCDLAKMFLIQNKISGELESRITQYLNYLWLSSDLGQGDELECLPDNLKKEIAMNVHMDTLKRVAIFQDCEPGLLEELVTKLKLQIYSPGDYVCRKGDVGREMYFIKMGSLQVVSPDGSQVYATLKTGAAFGEISILDIPGNKNGNKRTANIRSLGFADVFELSKSDLWAAISNYPLAKEILLQKGKALLKKDNLLDEELAELLELKQKPLHEQVDRFSEKCDLDKLNERIDRLQEKYKRFLKEKFRILNLIKN